MTAGEDGWLDPDDQMGLWEHQGAPLRVVDLRSLLADLPDRIPIRIEAYDGAGGMVSYRSAHIDLLGVDGEPSGLVITVVPMA